MQTINDHYCYRLAIPHRRKVSDQIKRINRVAAMKGEHSLRWEQKRTQIANGDIPTPI